MDDIEFRPNDSAGQATISLTLHLVTTIVALILHDGNATSRAWTLPGNLFDEIFG